MKDATRLNVMRKSRVEREETLLRRRHEMQEENLKRQVQILLSLNSKRRCFFLHFPVILLQDTKVQRAKVRNDEVQERVLAQEYQQLMRDANARKAHANR